MDTELRDRVYRNNGIFKIVITAGLVLINALVLTSLEWKSLWAVFTVTAIIVVILFTVWIAKLAIYQFLVPALIVLFILAGFPVVYTIAISFTNLDGESRLSKNEVKDMLLNKQWHFMPSESIYHAKYYFNEDVIGKIADDYIKLQIETGRKYDEVFDMNLPIDKENELLGKIDVEIDRFINRKLNVFSIENTAVVFYKEDAHDEYFVYIPSKQSDYETGFRTFRTGSASLSRFLSDYVLIGENSDDEKYSQINMKWLERFNREISVSRFMIDGKWYFHEVGSKYVSKMPLYIEHPGYDNKLAKLDTETLTYSIIVHEDDYAGRFVITLNDEEPYHYETFKLIQPVFKYPFFMPFRTKFSESFLSGKLNSEGFFHSTDKIFTDDFLHRLSEEEVSDELKKELKDRIRQSDIEVRKFNRSFEGRKGLKNQFRELYYRKIVFFPKLFGFSYSYESKNNIKPGGTIAPGYRVNVGLRHYINIFRAKELQSYYFGLFSWTLRWALLSLVFSFITGLAFAMILNNKKMPFKFIYRTLLLLPYAVPASISVMMWNMFLNTEFGSINALIGQPIPWLTNDTLSKFTSVVINVWLSFPYFMIISLGALQSIDPTLYEAAHVDGASKRQSFFYITLPMVVSVLLPLMVGYFGYSFNNFTIIYLLYGRGNDIVISFIYNLAARSRMFAFASAVSFITFLLIAPITYMQLKANNLYDKSR